MAEGIDDRIGTDIAKRYCDWPTRKTVDYRKEVVIAVREGHSDQVRMYVGESLVWNVEVADRRNHVPDHLGALAVQAVARPSGDVCLKRGPNKFCGD